MQFAWSFVFSLLSPYMYSYTHIMHMCTHIHTHICIIMCICTHNILFFLKYLRIRFTHHNSLSLNRLVFFTEGAIINFDNITLILSSNLYFNFPTAPIMFFMASLPSNTGLSLETGIAFSYVSFTSETFPKPLSFMKQTFWSWSPLFKNRNLLILNLSDISSRLDLDCAFLTRILYMILTSGGTWCPFAPHRWC